MRVREGWALEAIFVTYLSFVSVVSPNVTPSSSESGSSSSSSPIVLSPPIPSSSVILPSGQDDVPPGPSLRSFEGFSVFRLIPTSSEQLNFLRSLQVNDSQLDFWTQPTGLNKSVDVMVPPQEILRLEKSLRRLNINKHLMIDDVERMVKKERQSLKEEVVSTPPVQDSETLTYRTSFSRSSFFSIYQRIDSINEFLDNILYEYPDLVSSFSIGKSYEGRDLRLIKLSPRVKSSSSSSSHSPFLKNSTSSFDKSKRRREAIYLDGGFHAREWISVSTALFVLSQLATEYYTDGPDGDAARRLLSHYDVYILPIANPDGYEYTHSRDRLWRKTRSRHVPFGISIFGCRGVDPNRNFDHHWNEVGASDNPCTDIYAGPRAFSEPETKAVSDFILSHKDSIKMFFALHSYGELWLTPWGYTGTLPHNYYELEARGKAAADVVARRHGTKYRVGSATNILYAAAGGADDWAYGVAGIPYVYTIELRDTGRHGFILPKEHIVPTGEEFLDGLKHFALDLIPEDRRTVLSN